MMRALASILERIDGRGYKAYKELQGSTSTFEHFELVVDHVQGDPYAAPSRLRARVPLDTAGLPDPTLTAGVRRRATRDFLARAFRTSARRCRELGVDAGHQTVLDRTACLVADAVIELRITVDLPASGRRIRGRRAAEILTGELPMAVERAVLARHLDLAALERHCAVVEDQVAMRAALGAFGLVAFVGNGAVLPRRSGVDDRPQDDAVPFRSPPSLELELETPNAGTVRGMAIGRGLTLVVGGGFHGKSTLLRALEAGIWDHIPGDGREQVVSAPGVVKLRAEDGRCVHAVDISPFISGLPGGRETSAFSTELASGSTSQAAALVEALEGGADTLLLDEDTSATNFMIRDRRMQALVAKGSEPITPFVDRVAELRDRLGISTVLVMGGSGDYFDDADLVVQMDDYLPRDVTKTARRIAGELATGRAPEGGTPLEQAHPRVLDPRSLDPERARGRWRLQARGRDTLIFGRSEIDLRAVDQLVDPSQVRTIAWLLARLSEAGPDHVAPVPVIDGMLARLADGDWSWLTGRRDGDLALPRRHEVMAAVNRLRGARFAAGTAEGS